MPVKKDFQKALKSGKKATKRVLTEAKKDPRLKVATEANQLIGNIEAIIGDLNYSDAEIAEKVLELQRAASDLTELLPQLDKKVAGNIVIKDTKDFLTRLTKAIDARHQNISDVEDLNIEAPDISRDIDQYESDLMDQTY